MLAKAASAAAASHLKADIKVRIYPPGLGFGGFFAAWRNV